MLAARQTRVGVVRSLRPTFAAPVRVPVLRSSSAPAGQQGVSMASTKLYIGNLSWDTKADDLFTLFGKYGQVDDAFVASDRETGRSRGFGFVTLDAEAAKNAIVQTDGTEFMGRTIRVNEAQPREGGGGGGGGGGRGYGGGRGGGRGYGGGGDRYGGDRSYGGERSYGGGRGGGRGYGGGRGGGGRRDYGGDSYGGGGGY